MWVFDLIRILKSGTSILLILVFFNVNAQIVLQGKVIDNQTSQGIPYASVQIIKSAYGTACDQEGDFILKIDSLFFGNTLKVSCIGYHNAVLPIQNLLDSLNGNITISLDPFTAYLDEVVIKGSRQSPEEFLKEAIDAIPTNYIQQPFNMEIYSRLSVQDPNEITVYQIESILLTYSVGYITGSRNYYKLLQKRETGTMPMPFQDYIKNDKEYFPYHPGFTIAAFDQLGWGSEASTIFNPSYYKNLNFKYAGVSFFDQDTLIAIDYTSRKKRIRMNGTIYITLNNLAFIKHTINWGSTKQEIIYKKLNRYYYPYSVTAKRPATHDKSITLIDQAIITNIELDNVIPLEKKFDQWYPKGVPYDENFWNSNYPLKN